jgi:hypothetical protein
MIDRQKPGFDARQPVDVQQISPDRSCCLGRLTDGFDHGDRARCRPRSNAQFIRTCRPPLMFEHGALQLAPGGQGGDMRGSSSTIAEVHSDVEAGRLCSVISANSERTFPTTSRPASRAGGPDADRPRRLGLPARRSARHQAGPSYPCPGSAQPAPGRPPKLPSP